MTTNRTSRRRARGTVDELPSGALRVRVQADQDPITDRRHILDDQFQGAGAARRVLVRVEGAQDQRC